MSTTRKITHLDEIKEVREFLRKYGLKMSGWKRASIEKMESGYTKEFGTVRFEVGKNASVKADFQLGVSEDDIESLKDILSGYEMPRPTRYPHKRLSSTPKEMGHVGSYGLKQWNSIDWDMMEVGDPESIDEKGNVTRSKPVNCPILDLDGNLIMVEQRWGIFEGGVLVDKGCVRWTYFSDNVWRRADPEKLPIWGLEQLWYGPKSVILHEGPKAAYFGRFHNNPEVLGQSKRDLPNHPWHEFLKTMPHLGFIGGTHRTERIDLSPLKRAGVKNVYIIPDNDIPGRKAAYKMAEALTGMKVMVLPPYPKGFPAKWDVANGFEKVTTPDHVVREMVNNFVDITRMTTEHWAKGKPYYRIVEGFPQSLAYVEKKATFYSETDPFDKTEWEKMGRRFAPHIHAGAVSKFPGMVTESQPENAYYDLTFKPEQEPDIFEDGKRMFNVWRGPDVVPQPMTDVGCRLWGEYFERLIPDPFERKLFKRWLATTIARPARKYFGTILHGDEQGTGKTLLYDEVIKPLLGKNYCFSPSTDDLANKFNDWRIGKVLIYADELAGTKMFSTGEIYNKMKPAITSPEVRIEEKNKPHYMVPDYCKFLINSNKDVPLYMEASDRRLLVCDGAQIPMDRAFSEKLREWIRGDGLAEIYHWALNYASVEAGILEDEVFFESAAMEVLGLEADYIPYGANAPMTAAKLELLNNSKTKNQKTVESLLDALGEYKDGSERPVVVHTAVTDNALNSADINTSSNRKARYGKIGINGWWFCDARNAGGSHAKPHRPTFNYIDGRPRSVLLINEMAKDIIDREYPGAIETLSVASCRYNPKDGNWDELIRIAKDLGIYTDDQIMWSEVDKVWKPKGKDWDDKPAILKYREPQNG